MCGWNSRSETHPERESETRYLDPSQFGQKKATRARGKARVLVLPDGVSAKHVAKDSMRQLISKQEKED